MPTNIVNTSGVNGPATDFSSLTPGILVDISGNYVDLSPSGSTYGDVDGPASSTNNAIALFNGTTGKIIKNSNVTINGNDMAFAAGDVSISANGGNFITVSGGFAVVDSTTLTNIKSQAGGEVDITIGSVGVAVFQSGTARINTNGGTWQFQNSEFSVPTNSTINSADSLVVEATPAGYSATLNLAGATAGLSQAGIGGSSSVDLGGGVVDITAQGDYVNINAASGIYLDSQTNTVLQGVNSTAFVPQTSGTRSVGTPALPFASGNFLNLNLNGTAVRPNVYNEIPAGSINGVNTSFTLSRAPQPLSVALYYNGIYMIPSGLAIPFDYSVSSTTLTMSLAPASGSTLICNYQY